MHYGSRLIEGRYVQDILDQPKAIQDTLERLRVPRELYAMRDDLKRGKLKRIVLTGMGSSYFALTSCYLTLRASGYEVVMAETSELLYYLPGLIAADTLLVMVSQSGLSAEVLRMIASNAHGAPLVAVTNTPNSPLARASDALFLTNAGEEFSVSTKSYVTSLIALEYLAATLSEADMETTKQELAQLTDVAACYLAGWKQHVAEIADRIAGADQFFFLGRGRSMAAAGTGALITKESVRAHAEAMSSASFRHGPMEILSERVFVVMLEGATPTAKLNRQLTREIRHASGRTGLIGPDSDLAGFKLPPYSEVRTPILEILPLQMLTLALGYRSGVEAGNFIRATKVTTVE